MKRILVWLRNDLRLRDNPALHHALEYAEEIIPFYCFEDHYYAPFSEGFPKTGPFRAQFIRESVLDLKAQLQERGADLLVCRGDTLTQLQDLKNQLSFDAIYLSETVSLEEQELEQCVAGLGLPMCRFWQHSLYHKDDLPFERPKVPSVYTPFRKKVEKYATVPAPLPAPAQITIPKDLPQSTVPTLSDLGLPAVDFDKRSALHFSGGEQAAWARLEHYFWETSQLKEYKNTRNGLVGADYSSKFSPWLAQGCLSPRSVYAQIKDFEERVEKNVSTYWLFFELLWRDFFHFTAWKEGNHFFRMPRHWKPEMTERFEKWRQGETGQNFVDANMKELLYSGFMSNRGRQNVASFLVKDLGQAWILGARWFESQLIDYDISSNYGNWTYLAGIGHDPREDRWFNLEKQAERYDPEQEFRQRWLPNRYA